MIAFHLLCIKQHEQLFSLVGFKQLRLIRL